MTCNTLEFATREEIIHELFRRGTFKGVLVYSADDHKKPGQVHDDLRLITSLTTDETMQLLEVGERILSD